MHHFQHDYRSLLMHRLIARRVRRDPSLLEKAKENIHRWHQHDPDTTAADWLPFLNGPVDDLLALMKSKSARATQLRQSSPFAGSSFIQQEERMKIFEHQKR
jgi:hypothetical protein